MGGGCYGVNKIGAADRAQRIWRERRQEMNFTVNKDSLVFLFNMLRNPMALGDRIPQYKASDNVVARELLSLQKWITGITLDISSKNIALDAEFRRELSLKKSYVNRVIDMLEHYKDLGRMVASAESYWRLKDALEGKDFEASLDDPSGE
jgi:hypothetical protein